MTDLAIHALLHKRDELLGKLLAMRDRMASLNNDIEAIDRVVDILGYDGPPLAECQPRQARLVIFARNKMRRFLLSELRKGEPLSSRDLAERICCEEGKDIRDSRMLLEITKRVSTAMYLLQKRKFVRGTKDRAGRYMWGLAGSDDVTAPRRHRCARVGLRRSTES